MNEETEVLTEVQGTSQGPGERLKQARIAAQLTVDDVAKKLFLPSRIIRALEDEQYELTPGLAFVRGYLRQYARLLNLPQDEIVKTFDDLGLVEKQSYLTMDSVYKSNVGKWDALLPWGTGLIIFILFMFVFIWWHTEHTTESIIVKPNLVTEQLNSDSNSQNATKLSMNALDQKTSENQIIVPLSTKNIQQGNTPKKTLLSEEEKNGKSDQDVSKKKNEKVLSQNKKDQKNQVKLAANESSDILQMPSITKTKNSGLDQTKINPLF